MGVPSEAGGGGGPPARRLMLFEASCYGHHADYLRWLMEEWLRRGSRNQLVAVVSPEFAAAHRDVAGLAERNPTDNLRVIAFTEEEHRALTDAPTNRTPPLRELMEGRPNPRERPFLSWRLMSRYATRLGADRALLMYFDSCLLAAAARLEAPCPVSGIYFRPSFHYEVAADAVFPEQEKLQRMQEKFVLARVLAHPAIERLFCLDPLAAAALRRGAGDRSVYVQDPVEPPPPTALTAAQTKNALGIEPQRRTLLSFGAFSPRKGVMQVAEALSSLDESIAAKLCLVLVGPLKSQDRGRLDTALSQLAAAAPRLQIVHRFEHVPQADVAAYFTAADLVLATYQRHVGSSGVVLLAAAHRRPVLAQDYGHIGVMVRDHGLGRCIDSTNPEAIAGAVTEFVATNGADWGVDPEKRAAFVAAHSPAGFARTILDALDR
jgi:glycosyltransferase involved in cell wall biosynthesis